jgi:peptidyl-tRNA hydrolase
MSPGKIASQAGHAFMEAFLAAPPEAQAAYRKDAPGTKICLRAPT